MTFTDCFAFLVCFLLAGALLGGTVLSLVAGFTVTPLYWLVTPWCVVGLAGMISLVTDI